jgi:type IV pilus assembly protein PilM
MEFLPKALGTRPRLAVEVRTEGVVAARAEDATGLLMAVSGADLSDGALLPGLKAGNVAKQAEVVAAVRSALDGVIGRGSEKSRDVTVIVPDAAVRVLLLDFDALPSKAPEVMAVVRFRLKKLLPFEVEDASVSYQVMSSAKGLVTVLAVAVPHAVLAEYEGIVATAGYLPGAVLPSTLAALAGLGSTGSSDENSETATLLVNAGAQQVTTAIVRGGVLLLHRTLELESESELEPDTKDSERSALGLTAHVTAPHFRHTTVSLSNEVAQAVSVAAAYFEDTLGGAPELLLAAGTTGADSLEQMLHASGMDDLRVREMMEPGMVAAGAVTASVPRGWLAGVKGALTS